MTRRIGRNRRRRLRQAMMAAALRIAYLNWLLSFYRPRPPEPVKPACPICNDTGAADYSYFAIDPCPCREVKP